MAENLIVRCGTVVTAREGSCRVAMERDRCAGCNGRCSAGLGWLREVELEVAAVAPPAVGERVFVGVPRRGMTAAALTVFGLPLAGLAAGAAESTAWALLGFTLGASAALVAGRRGTHTAWLKPRFVGATKPPSH